VAAGTTYLDRLVAEGDRRFLRVCQALFVRFLDFFAAYYAKTCEGRIKKEPLILCESKVRDSEWILYFKGGRTMSHSPIPTPHINAPAGAFAETVLMPGDPLRAKFIAENFLENPELVNNLRGVQGYTGNWKGKRVSVMASGMGCPSIGIYSYELFHFYEVKNIIRIGSAGAISPELKLKDIVIGMSAYTNSGYINNFDFKGNLAPCCSYELLSKAVEAGKKLDCNVVCGPIFSSDIFYTGKNMQPELWELGILAVEMEAAALYLNAAKAKKNALAICTISDSLVTGEELSGEERQIGFRNMMEMALSIA
jgi:purine-nucleoside phosphorylase